MKRGSKSLIVMTAETTMCKLLTCQYLVNSLIFLMSSKLHRYRISLIIFCCTAAKICKANWDTMSGAKRWKSAYRSHSSVTLSIPTPPLLPISFLHQALNFCSSFSFCLHDNGVKLQKLQIGYRSVIFWKCNLLFSCVNWQNGGPVKEWLS